MAYALHTYIYVQTCTNPTLFQQCLELIKNLYVWATVASNLNAKTVQLNFLFGPRVNYMIGQIF